MFDHIPSEIFSCPGRRIFTLTLKYLHEVSLDLFDIFFAAKPSKKFQGISGRRDQPRSAKGNFRDLLVDARTQRILIVEHLLTKSRDHIVFLSPSSPVVRDSAKT